MSYRLGIDLGSISLKAVLLNGEGDVVFSRWTRVAGEPLREIAPMLRELDREFPGAAVEGIGATGSGRKLLAKLFGAYAVNEISAHAAAARMIMPHVHTIIEIGGQDSKLMVLDRDTSSQAVKDFRMNELCAAGTGAFLDQQASRLGLTIEQFAALAKGAKDAVPIAGRCAVFAKTDMTHHQQEGRPLADIVAGLNEALVRSYLANLVRGRELPRPIAFQGGVAANEGLVEAFRRMLDVEPDELIVPKEHKVMGAIGAASAAPKGRAIALCELADAFDRTRVDGGDSAAESCETSARLQEPKGSVLEPAFHRLNVDDGYLGIDVGSVSVKVVVVNREGVAYSDYRFSDGRPLDVLRTMLDDMRERFQLKLAGVGVTGSGRNVVGTLVDADATINEITAQTRAVDLLFPSIDTIVEIGGQDAKFMRVEAGRATYFSMNKVCAAGTGAFLQEQAKRLSVDLDGEFARMAFESDGPVALGARCTVFMESDLVSHQQQGYAKRDLIAGLAESVVANYVEKVISGYALGERVLFLGGVARNRAVVAALESHLGRAVATSNVSAFTGAIGAAIAASHAPKRRKVGKARDSFSSEQLDHDRFVCEGCDNRCSVIRTKRKPVRYFGGRCSKWDDAGERSGQAHVSAVDERAKLVEGVDGRGGDGPTIGIPRALMAFDKLPAWRAFFSELGCRVVVSPPSSGKLIGEGMKRLVVETCLPVKAFCAHLCWLDDHGEVDFIFVPSLVSTGRDKHGTITRHCPYVQSLVQFAKPIVNVPLLSPTISWAWDPRDERKAFWEMAKGLGKSRSSFQRAWESACEADRTMRDRLRAMGEKVLDDLAAGRIERAFVLLGKDYNLNDPMLNAGMADLLSRRGEVVITQDMMTTDDGDYSRKYRAMCWSHSKEMLAAAQRAAETEGLYPVMVSSFGCGPDSFTIRSVHELMRGKHMLVLDVDEHSASTGIETRIEAFLDSLPDRENIPRPASVRKTKVSERIERVFLPRFSDHGFGFAAALGALGLEPVLTDLPDDESARLGAAHATAGECHPFVLMLGDYIKTVTSGRDLSNACYFMPESSACRVGQFARQMNFVSESLGGKLPVFSSVGDFTPHIADSSFTARLRVLITYWEMVRGMDFLMQMHLETRAYEVYPGAADRAHVRGQKVLMEHILAGKPLEGLEKASGLLKSVAVDRTQRRVKIGITGDYFTRVCDYSNGDIFRDIERLGGVVMLPPTLTEFAKYDAYRKRHEAFNHRNARDFAASLVLRSFVERRERRVRKIFGDDLMYDMPIDYKRAVKMVKPYIDFKLPASLTGSIASILEQIDAGADGVLSLITFHCNYGLVINSVLTSMDKDYPDIPKLPLIFEGLKPTHNVTRLEAFMERVHSRKGKA